MPGKALAIHAVPHLNPTRAQQIETMRSVAGTKPPERLVQVRRNVDGADRNAGTPRCAECERRIAALSGIAMPLPARARVTACQPRRLRDGAVRWKGRGPP
jgi:hypothetical protein